ncbi:MAG: AsmA-like C-terminal region-containing protein [Bacteroidota bacterium]|nr:AsmA-like C-terminal region-containing protein [Bacteroidota bacterium]
MSKPKKPIWKRILKFLLWLTLLPVLLIIILITILYFNQDALVQKGLATVNENFVGELKLKDSHISPFHDFPNVSIDLEDIELYESKTGDKKPIAHIKDMYVDFDVRKLIQGKYRINTIELIGGEIKVIQDTLGNLNITKAFDSTGPVDTVKTNEVFKLGLKKIKIKNVDVKYIDETQKKTFDTKLEDINASFRTGTKRLRASVDGKFQMTFIKDKDTSFIKNKAFDIDAAIVFDKKKEILTIKPSKLLLEGVSFAMKGFMIFKGNPYMNLQFNGEKSDFNILFAFLPQDLATYMQKYKNAGNIYFDATVKGIVGNDRQPEITADFGCKNGFFTNVGSKKTVDKLEFRGYFTNGAKRNPSTFEIGLVDVFAYPEQGDVKGNIIVRNFDDPNVNMDVSTDFDLQFLAKFLQLQQLQNLSGKISLKVHYDELVDINAPKTTFAKLKDGVDSELHIKDLTFKMPKYPYPIKNVNLDAVMKNKSLYVEHCSATVGSSDINLVLGVNNLPAVFHKKGTPLDVHMILSSKRLDIKQLTTFDTIKMMPIDEVITGFQMAFTFKTKASNFTDTNMVLPHGEFYIDKLCGKLKHYARNLENLKADIIIDNNTLKLVGSQGKLGGKYGKSDFNISGALKNYPMWFKKNITGASDIDFNIACDTLRFGKTFIYKNVNYIPENYRRERLSDFKLKGTAKILYDTAFKSAIVVIESGSVKSKIHPLKLENLSGTIKYSDNRIRLRKFTGKMGKNEFTVSLGYFLGENLEEAKKDNRFTLRAKYLNLDELLNYDMTKVARKKKKDDTTKVVINSHDTIFNVFSLPFSNMKIKLDVKELLYHKIHLSNVKARMRMQKNHYFYIDTLAMDAADGHIEIDGYFNGSDKSKIYFAPNIKLQDVDLAKLMIKFDNFGQDYILSNNISGHLTGKLNGKIRMHTDLIPIMDESEITMKTSLTNGALNNYAPMLMLADYFKDKNLNTILFDTLQNTFEIKKGVMYIPTMNINSSLGFIEVSGKQAFTSDMDYLVKVPMKMVTDVGFKFLFGKKRDEADSTQLDGIVYRDKDKKVKFVNIKIKGNSEDFKISLGK